MFGTLTLTFLVLLIDGQVINKTHFYVQEGTEKCFLENVPESIPITVNYDNHDNPGKLKIGEDTRS